MQLWTEEKAHELGGPTQSQSLQGHSELWEPALGRQPEFVGLLKEACLCWESEVALKTVYVPRQRRKRRRRRGRETMLEQ